MGGESQRTYHVLPWLDKKYEKKVIVVVFDSEACPKKTPFGQAF